MVQFFPCFVINRGNYILDSTTNESIIFMYSCLHLLGLILNALVQKYKK
jgi:hypothetical protein